jgi:hypothetical protein
MPERLLQDGTDLMQDTIIETSIHIARSVEDVFTTLADPPGWPAWYPSSRSVHRTPDGAVEWLTPMGMPLRIRWRIQRTFPQGQIRKRGRIWGFYPIEIVYNVSPEDGGTRFHRLMCYPVPPGLGKIDRTVLCPFFQQESVAALNRFKQLLEGA